MGTILSTLDHWLRGLGPKRPAEKRRALRTPFAESIEVRTTAGTTFRGVGRDVSEGGLGAIVYADLNVGDSVVLYYMHPREAASQFVCHPALVRRRYGNRYGFEFQCA